MIPNRHHGNLEDEAEIVWLHPKERYDYLREGEVICTFKSRSLAKVWTPENCDGGAGTHIVAYATIKPSVVGRGYAGHHRRIWWVKGYDRFDGHRTTKHGFYDQGAPCEAVAVESIQVGKPSTGWDGTVNKRERAPSESNAG